MSCSTSSPSNTTSTSTTARETNALASGAGSLVVACSSGTTLKSGSCNTTNTSTTNVTVSTCLGAVKAGTAVASQAIACNTGLATSVSKGAASFACHALDTLSAEQISSASLVSAFLCKGQSLVANEQNALACAYTKSSQQLGNYATTLGNIATANDTSIASQQAAASSKMFQIGILAAVVIVIVIALEHGS